MIKQKGLHFLVGQLDETGEWVLIDGPHEDEIDLLDAACIEAQESGLYSQLSYVCGKAAVC